MTDYTVSPTEVTRAALRFIATAQEDRWAATSFCFSYGIYRLECPGACKDQTDPTKPSTVSWYKTLRKPDGVCVCKTCKAEWSPRIYSAFKSMTRLFYCSFFFIHYTTIFILYINIYLLSLIYYIRIYYCSIVNIILDFRLNTYILVALVYCIARNMKDSTIRETIGVTISNTTLASMKAFVRDLFIEYIERMYYFIFPFLSYLIFLLFFLLSSCNLSQFINILPGLCPKLGGPASVVEVDEFQLGTKRKGKLACF